MMICTFRYWITGVGKYYLVVGRNTEPISDIWKTDTDVGIWNTEKYRQLDTEKSVRFGILYLFHQSVA